MCGRECWIGFVSNICTADLISRGDLAHDEQPAEAARPIWNMEKSLKKKRSTYACWGPRTRLYNTV